MHKTFHLFKWSGKKAVLLLALAITILATTAGSTIAYFVAKTRNIPNNFPPAEIEISSWTYDDLINAGDTDIYVRASIVSAWVSNDDKKTVWAQTPVQDTDYTLTIDSEWFQASDGYYYRKEKIDAAQSVDFVHATQLTQKEGFTLKILVLYSAIQTVPEDAVENSWLAIEIDEDGYLKAR